MSQSRQSTSSIPPELRVDLSEIVEDLLAFHYDDISTSLSDNTNSTNSTLTTSGSNSADLIRRLTRMRSSIQRAQEAVRKLTTFDLDLPAQEKLLLAVANSCVTKRHLVCMLKTELEKLSSKDSDCYFE
ncbi:unnamed protein product [Trichobilharzia regenti]|uniref:Biogenesis of lysosome-related organelles complex 1 subunit 7 n=1 Tax=Trichobilharzia regenti TaxID=157069 RepID=A0A183WVG8_TRIRE|nr:unnamed protein product [Trichobilharzia regenti]VDQ12001.1 unnamed protein product [Trichobilharzia regenti]